jgi:aminopeptidase
MSTAAAAPARRTTKSAPRHAARLDRLAAVAIEVGLGLAPGQELLITASLDALPLVRRITERAYRAGASLVTTFYSDDEATLARFRCAPDASFDTAATWLQEGVAQAFRNNAARMAIAGANPALLAKEDPEKVGRANRSFSKATRSAMELITRHAINWTIVAAATPAWAAAVFPGEPKKVAMERLWDAIFAASRVDAPDPVAAWRAHDEGLRKRAALLNERRYSTVHFRGPGTDLRVGLADDHVWMGGGTTAGNGLACIPNIPTEEVFTTPHCKRVEGTVTSTKPLSYQGTLISGIEVRFEGGRVVESRASQGEAVLRKMLDTDEGAGRLGEVALVPHSSPIAASGLLFSNTLFDENAASHIALGQAYSTCIRGGNTMNAAALAEKGANDSLIHVDWMVGSGEIDLDGITADGTTEPLMRKGEWVS